VQTPPVSKCNDGKFSIDETSSCAFFGSHCWDSENDPVFLLAAGGASAPGAAAAAPTMPEAPTPAAAGSGSKTTPSGSGVSSLHGPASLVFALAAAAFYTVSTIWESRSVDWSARWLVIQKYVYCGIDYVSCWFFFWTYVSYWLSIGEEGWSVYVHHWILLCCQIKSYIWSTWLPYYVITG
jgi:hypothetical protein